MPATTPIPAPPRHRAQPTALRGQLAAVAAFAVFGLLAAFGAAAPAAAQQPDAPQDSTTAASPDRPRLPASGSATPHLRALRLSATEAADLTLDGILDEPAWQRADVAREFRQQEPDEGAPGTEPTEVRVAYDAENLYIGAILHDDPAGVLGNQMMRDAGLAGDDRFMWVLDTFLDGRGGYAFEVNPAGLMGDALIRSSPTSPTNKAWDGIWEARAARGDWGWSVEIRIPFSTLNFDPARDTWGINFQRTIRRRNEELLWAGHLRTQGLIRLGSAGRLTGLEGLSQGVGVEVRPFVTAGWEKAPAYGVSDAETPADLGFDATYSITPSLRTSITVNTDFAETEVDARQVNLTRFPVVFPERRDFFLEGSGTYRFAESSGPRPFFSRRIGLFEGAPVPITAGARLDGQAGAWDLGLMQIRTADHAFGPAEDFTVARARRNILAQSTIGAIFTRRHMHAGDVGPATAPGTAGGLSPAEALALYDVAPGTAGHTLGADLDLFTTRFLGDRNLQFEAFLVWHDDPVGVGTTFGDRSARGIRINYPNDLVRVHTSYREFGDAYAPAAGFVPRNGFRRLQPTLTLQPRPDWAGVRNLDFVVQVEHLTDLDGRLETFNVEGTIFGVRLDSGDNARLQIRHDFEWLARPFRIHSGVVVPSGEHTFQQVNLQLNTASHRLLGAGLELSRGGFWTGDRTRFDASIAARPRRGLTLAGFWEHNAIDLPEGDFATNLWRMEGGWQGSPWLSFTTILQYDDVSEVAGLFGRLRWTVRPGSDVFLVYTHNLQDAALVSPELLGNRRPTGWYTLERRGAMKVAWAFSF